MPDAILETLHCFGKSPQWPHDIDAMFSLTDDKITPGGQVIVGKPKFKSECGWLPRPVGTDCLSLVKMPTTPGIHFCLGKSYNGQLAEGWKRLQPKWNMLSSGRPGDIPTDSGQSNCSQAAEREHRSPPHFVRSCQVIIFLSTCISH